MKILVRMATKPGMYRVYLNDDAISRMVEGAKRNELGQSELLSKLAAEALRALEENDYKITLPLRLKITSEPLHRHVIPHEPSGKSQLPPGKRGIAKEKEN